MVGGVQAVAWADVKQMVLMLVVFTSIIVVLLMQIPVSADDALHIAGAAGRMQIFDTKFDLANRYTLWSGLIGGTFLMLSYFGTDQSQVQRYLAAKSVPEARSSLLMSAYWKIPLQAVILLVGVLVFVFYLFQSPPLYWNPANASHAREKDSVTVAALEARYAEELAIRRAAAIQLGASKSSADVETFRASNARISVIRDSALKVAGQDSNADANYIIPRFVLSKLPLGLAGLFIAAVIGAAMAASSAELSSLSTTTVIDFYRRWVRPEAPDAHYMVVSRAAVAFWGVFVCVVAIFAASLGPLIEVVNRFGSFFYGSILGVFLLAMFSRARAAGAFFGLVAGMAAVGYVNLRYDKAVAFLWHNVIGAVVVVVVGLTISLFVAQAPTTDVTA
jgi:Na+/proline symporter